MVSKKNRTSRNSFKARLCASKNDDIDVDDERDGYFNNESNYLLCGIICTKSMVIIFNFLFILSGILLTLFGVWTLLYKQEYADLLKSNLYQLSTYILILAGAVIIIAGIIGILGAWFESKKLIIVFIALLVSIFVIEMASGVLAFTYKVKLTESLKYDLETTILNEYNQTGFETKSALLDNLQTSLKCCGATDFLDWKSSKYILSQNNTSHIANEPNSKKYNQVAESCCKSPSHLCARRTHPSNINYKGCVMVLEKQISKHLILIGVVSISACLFQSIGFFLAALLIKRINQRKQYSSLKSNDN